LTPAGAQTSTTGASITDSGVLLSLRAFDTIIDIDARNMVARVGSGVLLGDLQRELAALGLFFAPDPTSEEESTVGGAIACNASGPRTLRYGPTRHHVRALTIAFADGSVRELRRPVLEKNTVGYGIAQNPMDWFIGSEGTLGVILEAELALLPEPHAVIGLGFPFPTEAAALAFIVGARREPGLNARCLEYMDNRAVNIMRAASGSETWAAGAHSMVYAEEVSEQDVDAPLDGWIALAERHGALSDDIQVYDSTAALKEARRLRHAVPASMNEQGNACRAQGGRKVSTDWAVPHERLAEAIAVARDFASDAGLEQPAIYGHAGNGHPHQNFIARTGDELRIVESVVEQTLRYVVACGGTVAAEHGIGKIKRRWLSLQLTPLQLSMMRAIKRELDPSNMFAPGNIL
jgi:FAD/FMN-containing dehydrogenase